MFYFVSGDENVIICVACEEKQWCFTLDKTSEFGNQFYSLLKNNKLLTKSVDLYYSNAKIYFNRAEINHSQIPRDPKFKPKPGDIVFYDSLAGGFYIDFFYVEMDEDIYGLKVGKFEGSSLEDFKSFLQGKYNVDDVQEDDGLYFTFSMKEPLEPKIIVTTIIWLLLLLPLLFLVYFIFK